MTSLLTNFVANKLKFSDPMEIPPTNFNLDQAALAVFDAKYRYTPDASLLSQYDQLPIFIYDRLMEGRDDHDQIVDFISSSGVMGFTRDHFCTWRKNLGKLSFPIAIPTNERPDNPGWSDLVRETCWWKNASPALVRGVVHLIQRERIYELDKHYRNTVNYIRKKVKIQIPQTKSEHSGSVHKDKPYMLTMWCWMYVGKPEHWEPLLDNGYFFSPVRIFNTSHPLVKEYSFFEQPTGEVPKEDVPMTHIKKITQKPYPLIEGNRVVGSGFEHTEIEVPLEDNPYKSQIDGASPVQRIINEE
jgi:hypothetical protein